MPKDMFIYHGVWLRGGVFISLLACLVRCFLGVRCGPVLQLPNFVNSVNGRGKNRWEATRVLEKRGPKTHLAVALGAPLLAMIQHC